jgi:hypothetical protein
MKGKKHAQAPISVGFGGISFGKATAKLTVSTSREDVPLSMAEELLCGARLNVELRVTDGQPMLPGVEKLELATVADCKSLRMTPGSWSFGLTFVQKGLDANLLLAFRNCAGEMIASRIGDATGSDEDPDADEKADDEKAD